METATLITFLLAAGFSAAGILFWLNQRAEGTDSDAQIKMRAILNEAKLEAQELKQKAREAKLAIVREEKEKTQKMHEHIERMEQSLKLKEKQFQSQSDKNSHLEKLISDDKSAIKNLKNSMDKEREEVIATLLKTVKKDKATVIQEHAQSLYNMVIENKETTLKKREEEVKEDELKLAKTILINALERYNERSSVDRSSNQVNVKKEPFKATMVGKDAETIRHLEEKTELVIVFNDAPKTITIVGGNVMKRQVAKAAIEILQESNAKKITPKDVDIALEKGERKVKKIMIERAKWASRTIGLQNPPEGILEHIGRLHFRTSYGQNALMHCIEVGVFSGLIAAHVGADIEVARIAGFFHDIGKSISEESDKGHDFITKDILEEHNYPEAIIHAAWVHHEAQPANSLEAKIVMAADAMSASRPGARMESLEHYIQRIRALESTAASFKGIQKTYAISAGREVRVIVDPKTITDKDLENLAHDIAQKIEDELTYPGNVKVNLIRRMRWWSKTTPRNNKGHSSKK